MKKTKITSILALALSAMMTLTACGTSSKNTSTKPAETQKGQVDQGPPTELTVAFLTTGPQPPDQTLVEEALNKIVTPKINAKVKLLPINFGAAMQQYNVMLASNEKLDLMLTFPNTYQSLVAQKKVQEIGPLVDKYGQGIKDNLGNFIKGNYVNGKLYGVRPLCDMAGGNGLIIRKDIIDKYKIDVTQVKSFADLGNVFKTIKDNDPNLFPVSYGSQGIGFAESVLGPSIDWLGDYFGVLMNYGQDLKVVNMFETQEYKDLLKTMRDWYQKGYVMKDVAYAKEDQHTLVKSGKALGYFSATKPGVGLQESATNGYECTVIDFAKPMAGSAVFSWVVPNAAKTPDKSVQLLNLMYTDPEVQNLMSWGIEGKHYEKKSDGTIGFPSGITDKNSGYYLNTPWMFGNEFLSKVWQGNPTDIWQQTKKFNESATTSKAMGFIYDPTPVKTEIAALSNVWLQYKLGLESGTVDPDKTYPEFIQKIKAAGIDKVIAEKQKQLDAWAAANNVK
jgi:putative aldouronate transport system substrate-binding protein